MRKLIALDIDGTLVGREDRISQRMVAAVNEARRLGAVVTLATGRRLRFTLDIADQLGISVPLILYNGSLIVESRPLRTLYVKTIATATAQRMIDLIHSEGQAAFVYAHTPEPPDVFFEVSLPIHAEYIRDIPHVARVENLSAFSRECEVVRVMTWGDAAPVNRLIERARDGFGSHETTMIWLDHMGHRNIEFYPPGVSKAGGIALLADSLGIGRSDVVAIGDGINDVEMIEYAGLGIAMGNACDELKRIADCVTGTVDEDGAATAIEKLIAEAATA